MPASTHSSTHVRGKNKKGKRKEKERKKVRNTQNTNSGPLNLLSAGDVFRFSTFNKVNFNFHPGAWGVHRTRYLLLLSIFCIDDSPTASHLRLSKERINGNFTSRTQNSFLLLCNSISTREYDVLRSFSTLRHQSSTRGEFFSPARISETHVGVQGLYIKRGLSCEPTMPEQSCIFRQRFSYSGSERGHNTQPRMHCDTLRIFLLWGTTEPPPYCTEHECITKILGRKKPKRSPKRIKLELDFFSFRKVSGFSNKQQDQLMTRETVIEHRCSRTLTEYQSGESDEQSKLELLSSSRSLFC